MFEVTKVTVDRPPDIIRATAGASEIVVTIDGFRYRFTVPEDGSSICIYDHARRNLWRARREDGWVITSYYAGYGCS